MKCSICLGAAINPIELDCKHTFCYQCIYRWVAESFPTYPTNSIPNCPICRTAIIKLDRKNKRKTRTMTRLKRCGEFTNHLIIKVHQWKQLKDDKTIPIPKKNQQLFFFLDEILNLIYHNKWFFNEKNPEAWSGWASSRLSNFRNIIKKKLDTFEQDGYKEANIWKYKLRHILN